MGSNTKSSVGYPYPYFRTDASRVLSWSRRSILVRLLLEIAVPPFEMDADAMQSNLASIQDIYRSIPRKAVRLLVWYGSRTVLQFPFVPYGGNSSNLPLYCA